MKDKLEFLKRPWLIAQDAFEILSGYDLDKCAASEVLATASLSEYEEKPKDQGNGVTLIDIDGPLMPNPSMMARFFLGAVDLFKVTELINAAKNDPRVEALVLNVNSPGGTVTGTPEAGASVDAFVASGKPLYVFSRTQVSSAAYWLAAGATEIAGTPSSRWGNIGAIRPHVDLSASHEAEGMKVILFTSGTHKGAGAMNTSLSDEQAAAIQGEIDDIGEQFRQHVEERRPSAKREDMEALSYYAPDAVAKGLIDTVVSDLSEFLARVSASLESPVQAPQAIAGSVDTILSDNAGETLAKPHMSNPTEPAAAAEGAENTPVDPVVIDAAAGDLTPQPDAATLALEAKVDALASALTKSNEALAAIMERLPEKAAAHDHDEVVARAAARLAAESGQKALDSEGKDIEATDYSALSESALWEEYRKVLAKDGRDAASAFYGKHMKRAAN